MRRAVMAALGLALWASPRRAEAGRSCSETNRVVGFRRCANTDRWRADTDGPAFWLRPALNVGVVHAAPMRFVDSGQRSYAGSELGDRWLEGAGFGIDLGVTAWRHVYLGANLGLLSFRMRTPQPLSLPEWTTVLFVGATHLHAAALVGAAFAVGPVALRGSLSVGWQQLALVGTLQTGELQGGASAVAPELLLRPRISAEWFFAPEGSLQCELGVDVAMHFSAMASLAVVFHSRFYDGLHSRP